ncbi:MAG TPA: alpha/beta fold hydrolase [Acidimicrobiales bacterium]|nr:alpha/beta fold hydrolase [Acidimicrobiales bacterium]
MDESSLGGLTARERDVALIAAAGLDTRSIAQRLCLSPRTVEHHLSAAYRKLGVANRTALAALVGGRQEQPVPVPVTRYAVNGDAHIAYQTIGDGPDDLLFIPGFVSNVEAAWTWPAHARFLRRLASGRRLIVFDKRGTGLSDPFTNPGAMTLEQRMEDARAVLDAVGSRRPYLFGFSEGAGMAMLFAGTYPSRAAGLILYGALISPTIEPQSSPFSDPAAAWEAMRQVWGTGRFLSQFAPSLAGDDAELAHVARFERHGASPAAAYAIFSMAAAVELRDLCPAIGAPALVMHRGGDPLVPCAHGRYLADHLPNARYVELEGDDHPPWIGANTQLLDEIDRWLATEHPSGPPASVLQAVLVMDRVPPPGVLPVIERFRGRPTPGGGDTVAYAFEGAVRAVACALSLARAESGLRMAVHAGELAIDTRRPNSPVLATAAAALRVGTAAQVAVTRVVRDLTFGSGFDLRAGPEVDLPNLGPSTLFLASSAGDPTGDRGGPAGP